MRSEAKPLTPEEKAQNLARLVKSRSEPEGTAFVVRKVTLSDLGREGLKVKLPKDRISIGGADISAMGSRGFGFIEYSALRETKRVIKNDLNSGLYTGKYGIVVPPADPVESQTSPQVKWGILQPGTDRFSMIKINIKKNSDE